MAFVFCVPTYSEPTPEQVKERTNLLIRAIEDNNAEQAKICIKLGADIKNATCKYVYSPRSGSYITIKGAVLNYAVYKNRKDIVEMLINAGADVNAKDSFGNTTLRIAAGSRNKDIAKLLIDAGADVNAKDSSGNTTLRIAVGDKDITKLLIDAGADVNAKDSSGNTALTIAAYAGSEDVVELLIKAGANIKEDSSWRVLLIDMVCSNIHYYHDIAELLIKAVGDVEIKDDKGDTLLIQAIKARADDGVKFLIGMGADVNATDCNGLTALACSVLYGRNDIANMLKAAGAKE